MENLMSDFEDDDVQEENGSSGLFKPLETIPVKIQGILRLNRRNWTPRRCFWIQCTLSRNSSLKAEVAFLKSGK